MTAAIATALYLVPAGAHAAVAIIYHDGFTTDVPGAPSGRAFDDQFSDSGDAQGKPTALSHFHLQLPLGAHFDTTAVPQCPASDLELMLIGGAACQPGSKIGSETFVFDTGLSGPGRFDTSDVTFFNELHGVILVSQDRQSGLRVVTHGKIGADTEDIDLPLLPGTPPDGGADRQETAQYPVALGDRDGRVTAYLTTPSICPSTGRWTFQATYTFHDGEQQTVTSSSPCRLPTQTSVATRRQPASVTSKRSHRRSRHRRHGHRARPKHGASRHRV